MTTRAIHRSPVRSIARGILLTPGFALQPETIVHIARVEAAGGYVEDVAFLDSFFRLAKFNSVPFIADIVAAYSPSWGVKGGATASDLFSLTGVGSDLAQAVGTNQPLIKSADLNSKTRLLFDGVNDCLQNIIFSWGSSVRTIAIGGFEQESWTVGRRVTSDSIDSTRIRQIGTTPILGLYDGTIDANIRNSNAAIGSPVHFNGLFDGASSAILVDNANQTTGSIGTTQGNGITLGADFTGGTNTNISVGIFVLLKSVNDADYAAKMTALYNFSKPAYGTP